MSDLAAIVKRLVEAGAEPAVAAPCVVEAYEAGRNASDDVTLASRDVTRDSVTDSKEQARLRQQKRRAAIKEAAEKIRVLETSPEANDAGENLGVSRDVTIVTRDVRDKRCNLSSLLTEDDKGIREVSKKEAGSEVVALAKRGTRLRSDAPLGDADRQFAIEHGCPDPHAFWVEFVDYWIAVPGQRGTKLDWPATWRNRVREKFSKTGGQNGRRPFTAKPSLASRAYAIADKVEQRESSEGFAGPPVYVRGG